MKFEKFFAAVEIPVGDNCSNKDGNRCLFLFEIEGERVCTFWDDIVNCNVTGDFIKLDVCKENFPTFPEVK